VTFKVHFDVSISLMFTKLQHYYVLIYCQFTALARSFKKLPHLPTVVQRSWSSSTAVNTDASRRFLEVRTKSMRSVHRRRPTSCHPTVLSVLPSGDSSAVTRVVSDGDTMCSVALCENTSTRCRRTIRKQRRRNVR